MEQKLSERQLKIRVIYLVVMFFLIAISVGFWVSSIVGPTLNPIQ